MKRIQANVFYNTKCIKCNCCDNEMVKVGPIPFCNDCYSLVFGGDEEINKNNKKYQEWLKYYKGVEK